jgi:hypothetical protein
MRCVERARSLVTRGRAGETSLSSARLTAWCGVVWCGVVWCALQSLRTSPSTSSTRSGSTRLSAALSAPLSAGAPWLTHAGPTSPPPPPPPLASMALTWLRLPVQDPAPVFQLQSSTLSALDWSLVFSFARDGLPAWFKRAGRASLLSCLDLEEYSNIN